MRPATKLIRSLKKFVDKYNHSFVPNYSEHKELYDLTAWARKNSDELTLTEKEALDEYGFPWQATKDECKWQYNYHLLKAYRDKHGDTLVPYNYQDDLRLARWVVQQRVKSNRLSFAQKSLLEGIDFQWSASESTWSRMYGRLTQFFQEHGHSQVPSTYQDKKLASWVVRQRLHEDQLTDNQREQLDKVAFQFKMSEQRDMIWEFNFQQLILFKDKHGHTNVPQTYRNKRLANWVRTQRKRSAKLSKDQRNRLLSIGFLFKGERRKLSWQQQYEAVLAYWEKHKKLPPDTSLQNWYYRQKRRDLSSKEKELLTKIGF